MPNTTAATDSRNDFGFPLPGQAPDQEDDDSLLAIVRRLRRMQNAYLPHEWPPVQMAEIVVLLDALGLDDGEAGNGG
jgi:hypothetical protein